ncbi:ATP/GTP-binding protein [Streptomyces sp. MS2.AVA.5]|uniref:ATP/GTP-binding protein n=1 Tax=Streptomyces achmelvichensis TaxID=3134111 RepID=A0ACC6Q8S8_9ACTN
MLRRSAAVAVLVTGLLAQTAVADDGGPTVGNDGTCEGSMVSVTLCAQDPGSPGGGGGNRPGPAGGIGTGSSSGPKCTYEKADPQPPPENLAWPGRNPGEGSIYRVVCDDLRTGVVWLPNGAAPPAAAVDPEVLAQRAVDAMKLKGPAVASPRTAGRYTVGVPVWMWVDQESPTRYGPVSESVTAGVVTVSATARVTSIRWSMGDGTTVTCHGPGTAYTSGRGMKESPDCGHIYARTSANRARERFTVSATSTWRIDWTVNGGAGGQLTETRSTQMQVPVRELQAVGR